MYTKNDLQNIQVSISLKDLKELQEKAEFYYILSEENSQLRLANANLKEQLTMKGQ